MALSNRAPGQGIVTLTAEATIADGCVVMQGAADDKCKLPTGAASDFAYLGIAKREGGGSYSSGQGVDVVLAGVYPGIASGTITRFDRLTVASSTGNVKTASLGTPATAYVGYALESASDGERVAILITPEKLPGLVVNTYVADGAITANTAVKIGGANGKAATATADPTSGLLGIALNTVADGGTVFVACNGSVVPCITQANVTRSNNVTVGDANGGIKPAAPASGVNVQILGVATASATAPATALIHIGISMMQGQ
jgi:hypothetical protein